MFISILGVIFVFYFYFYSTFDRKWREKMRVPIKLKKQTDGLYRLFNHNNHRPMFVQN